MFSAKLLYSRKKAAMEEVDDRKERFQACMVLAGVGDALGYGNGSWGFNPSGVTIHEDAKRHGGVENIQIEYHSRVSGDTVMHIATANALVSHKWQDHENLLHVMAKEYIDCMRDMNGRAAGATCSSSIKQIAPKDYHIRFNPRGGGRGAAIRATPIGLYYWRPEQINSLLKVAIESGRMTHNHPTGYLGSLATALFVSYAVQKKPLREWGAGLVQTLPIAKEFIISTGRDVEENLQNWDYFEMQWKTYLKKRKIEDGMSEPVFDYNDTSVKARDAFYKELSFDGTGGASGHDAPMIAYEALLGSQKSNTIDAKPTHKMRQWVKLCKRGMLHGGNSNSTGIIAAACWGAMEGFNGVPENHYLNLDFYHKLKFLGNQLFDKANSTPTAADESCIEASDKEVINTIDSKFSIDPEKSTSSTESGIGGTTEKSIPPIVDAPSNNTEGNHQISTYDHEQSTNESESGVSDKNTEPPVVDMHSNDTKGYHQISIYHHEQSTNGSESSVGGKTENSMPPVVYMLNNNTDDNGITSIDGLDPSTNNAEGDVGDEIKNREQPTIDDVENKEIDTD